MCLIWLTCSNQTKWSHLISHLRPVRPWATKSTTPSKTATRPFPRLSRKFPSCLTRPRLRVVNSAQKSFVKKLWSMPTCWELRISTLPKVFYLFPLGRTHVKSNYRVINVISSDVTYVVNVIDFTISN